MKRSQELRPLSRDHHQVLEVALRLQRSEDPQEAALYFLVFWERHGKQHFRDEEEVLLPIWAAAGTVDEAMAARMTREHRQIRAAAWSLRNGDGDAAQITQLADLLRAHVRFEERELFPAIETDLGEALHLYAEATHKAGETVCATS